MVGTSGAKMDSLVGVATTVGASLMVGARLGETTGAGVFVGSGVLVGSRRGVGFSETCPAGVGVLASEEVQAANEANAAKAQTDSPGLNDRNSALLNIIVWDRNVTPTDAPWPSWS